MTTANKRQRERLLELIRRLAEDDKNGVMAQKVLKLFWTLAHSQEVPPEVLDQALGAVLRSAGLHLGSVGQQQNVRPSAAGAQECAWLACGSY